MPNLMRKIVALCKRRGFIFESSEIYSGIKGFWDYGPADTHLERNIKDAWWNGSVGSGTDVVGTATCSPEKLVQSFSRNER